MAGAMGRTGGTGTWRQQAGGLLARLAIGVALALPAAGLTALIPAQPALAQSPGQIRLLSEALMLEEVIAIMRDEGIAYGGDLADDMFPGRGNSDWSAMVLQIYDAEAMHTAALAGLAKALDGEDIQPILDFLLSDLGNRVTALEVSARQALMDPDVEAANDAMVADLREAGDARITQVTAFIEVNDLIEANLVGALNSNYAFYMGLIEGDALPEPMSQEEVLSEVWAQEADIRVETERWLYGFLSLAYQPLTDAELQTYIDFAATDAGQSLNRALFAGFDPVFEDISRSLGLAAAQMLTSEEL